MFGTLPRAAPGKVSPPKTGLHILGEDEPRGR
jgi:hypothetical protein